MNTIFENVSFGIQRHQIKILVCWNFNITHILVVGRGNITKDFHLLLSQNSAMLTDHQRCFLEGNNVFQLFCYHLFLVSLIWDTAAFQCNEIVKSVLTMSLDKEE